MDGARVGAHSARSNVQFTRIGGVLTDMKNLINIFMTLKKNLSGAKPFESPKYGKVAFSSKMF